MAAKVKRGDVQYGDVFRTRDSSLVIMTVAERFDAPIPGYAATSYHAIALFHDAADSDFAYANIGPDPSWIKVAL